MDPEWGLYHSQRALWDPVDPTRLGSLKPELRFHVNGETYRFADAKTLHQFMMSPQTWCGLLRDPVTGNKFMPTGHSPEAYWIGGPYFFQSDSTKMIFVQDPHRYEVIRRL